MLDCQLDKDGNPRPKRPIPKIIGIRQHMEIQRVKQMEKQGPDSWLVRKVRRRTRCEAEKELTFPLSRTVRGRTRRWNLRLQLLCLRRATMHTDDPDGERPTRWESAGSCVRSTRPSASSRAQLPP